MRALLTGARRTEMARIVLVGAITLLFWQGLLTLAFLLVAIAIGLYPLARTGLEDLIRERKIGTELFVTVATVIALLGGEYIAASVLMTIILIAEFIADLNVDRARASIRSLIGSAPQTATLRTGAGDRTVPISELTVGAVVLVRAGEKIPADGVVVEGAASVNEAVITGESLPRDATAGADVLAGTIVESGAIDVRTERVGTDTTFARIIALVEGADAERAPVQKLADRVAAWLLPLVLIFLIVVWFVTRDVSKVVALLIFTSPAELGLATPMVMLAAVARAARAGILVKGGLFLERLAKADAIVFDKTGTLTLGEPRVLGVRTAEGEIAEDQLLRYAASADARASHPLARAVVKAAQDRGIALEPVESFETVHGRGVSALVQTRAVLVGNEALLEDHGVQIPEGAAPHAGTTVHVAIDGRYAGALLIADQLRDGAADAVRRLADRGVRRLVILTGDSPESAAHIAQAAGITDVRARLLPEDKVQAIDALRAEGFVVAMIGDGVNDAPALARADVGIAMGARGTQAAIEAADIALMTDDLGKVVFARALARRAYRTVQENLIVGVGVVHVLGIAAALAGWIGPIEAALLHLGPDVLVFVNSIKLLRVRIDGVNGAPVLA